MQKLPITPSPKPFHQLRCGFKNSDRGWTGSLPSDGDKQPSQVRCEETSSRALDGGNSDDFGVVIRILLAENRYSAFASNGINPLPDGIKENIVTVTHCGQGLDDLAGVNIEGQQLRWVPGDNEQSVVRFIERHRIVRKRQSSAPPC